MKSIEQQAFEAAQKYYQEAFNTLKDSTLEFTAFMLAVTGILIPLLINLWNSRQLEKAEAELTLLKNQLFDSNEKREKNEKRWENEFEVFKSNTSNLLRKLEGMEKTFNKQEIKTRSMANYVLHISHSFTKESEFRQSTNKNSIGAQTALEHAIKSTLNTLKYSIIANPSDTSNLVGRLKMLLEFPNNIPFNKYFPKDDYEQFIEETKRIEPQNAQGDKGKILLLTTLSQLKK